MRAADGFNKRVLSAAERLFPFAALSLIFAAFAYVIPVRRAEELAKAAQLTRLKSENVQEEQRDDVRQSLRIYELEVKLGKQISAAFMTDQAELSRRVAKMRRKFAQQYGFILPEIRITDDLSIGPKRYQIAIHGTIATAGELRIGDVLVVTGDGQLPDLPCDITKEPAFGMKAVWVTGAYSQNLQRNGFKPIDPMSVLLTHLVVKKGSSARCWISGVMPIPVSTTMQCTQPAATHVRIVAKTSLRDLGPTMLQLLSAQP